MNTAINPFPHFKKQRFMIIEITLAVIGGSTIVGVFIHQLSKSLHSPNELQQQNANYQQLLDVGSHPLSSLHQRESYYTTRRIEKQQAHTAILQEIEGKRLNLQGYYNKVEGKVLELKSTLLDVKAMKIEVELGRKLQAIEHRENTLEIKQLTLANQESLFNLKKQTFDIVKNRELLALEQKAFDLDKVSFANEQQKKFLELDTKQKQLELEQYSLELVGKTIEQQWTEKKLALDFRQNEQSLTQQRLQLQRTSNANFYAAEKLALDKRQLNLDRKKWELDRDKPTISLPLQSSYHGSSTSDDWAELKEVMRAERFEKQLKEASNNSNQNTNNNE